MSADTSSYAHRIPVAPGKPLWPRASTPAAAATSATSPLPRFTSLGGDPTCIRTPSRRAARRGTRCAGTSRLRSAAQSPARWWSTWAETLAGKSPVPNGQPIFLFLADQGQTLNGSQRSFSCLGLRIPVSCHHTAKAN
eukprot:6174023-Pleurochrysis_carterae.AAC.8